MSSDYILAYGTHASPQDGRCAMEWVSYLAGEPHSDQPTCVSAVLRAMCIALNDGLDQEPRQRLRPYLTRTIGTAEDGLDTWRGWLAMDWLARSYTPAWLRLAGLTDPADALESAEAVTGADSLTGALELLEARPPRVARRPREGVRVAAAHRLGGRRRGRRGRARGRLGLRRRRRLGRRPDRHRGRRRGPRPRRGTRGRRGRGGDRRPSVADLGVSRRRAGRCPRGAGAHAQAALRVGPRPA